MDDNITSKINLLCDRLSAIESGQVSDVDAALSDAISIYKESAALVDNIEAFLGKRAKRIVGDILTETGQRKAVTSAGQAYFAADSVSIAYDAKAIDALCLSNDNLARILAPHRKETPRNGALTIK